ncbi:MAG TPA: N-acetylmuramoyl-L-alanine amidase [Thermomicrobiaceae bacterium]|nr:N-acetylmuramoyl-L-alanine amidase [Thermomicrobiaceae bacterium]
MVARGNGRRRYAPLVLLGALLMSCGGGPASGSGAAGTPVRPLAIRNAAAVSALHSGVVFLDPGHGGIDSGTTGIAADGTLVEEKTVVLQIALRTAQRLRSDGVTVVLSRTSDQDPCATPSDYTADGTAFTPDGEVADLQCRIDKANASHAQALVSFHMNTFADPSVGGTTTFYDSTRSFAARSQQLAQLIQQSVIGSLHGQGFTTPDRGVVDDTQLQVETINGQPSSYNHLDLLGPVLPGKIDPPSAMPGALCEIFFLSDSSEATAAADPAMQDLLAGAFATAIEQFLSNPGGS